MFISAGHSNSDPGAVANGKTEADIAVEFRNIVSFYLQQFQVPHVLDGNGTVNLPLTSAAKTARGHKIAVEFHCNASDNPKATGVEVLCGKDADDNLLAKKIAASLAAGLGIANRPAQAAGVRSGRRADRGTVLHHEKDRSGRL
jgi:N-acetylmuramoyl-L-alanine amidase